MFLHAVERDICTKKHEDTCTNLFVMKPSLPHILSRAKPILWTIHILAFSNVNVHKAYFSGLYVVHACRENDNESLSWNFTQIRQFCYRLATYDLGWNGLVS